MFKVCRQKAIENRDRALRSAQRWRHDKKFDFRVWVFLKNKSAPIGLGSLSFFVLHRVAGFQGIFFLNRIKVSNPGGTPISKHTPPGFTYCYPSSLFSVAVLKRCSHTIINNSGIKILLVRRMFPEKISNSILCHKQSKRLSLNVYSAPPVGQNEFQSSENRKLAIMELNNEACFRFNKVEWNNTGILENPNG